MTVPRLSIIPLNMAFSSAGHPDMDESSKLVHCLGRRRTTMALGRISIRAALMPLYSTHLFPRSEAPRFRSPPPLVNPRPARHNDQVQAYCVYLEECLPWDQVASWLEMLTTYRGDDILRIKGILNVLESETPVVVHGVQHMFHPPVQLDSWPDDERRSRIVFITRGLDQDIVENMLSALTKKQGEGAIQEA